MASVRTPPERWVEGGLEALATGGPDAVRVEPLAKALGVSKGGFYWHFSGRRDLLDAILDSWERRSVEEVVELVERAGGDGRARLRHLFTLAAEGEDLLAVDLAVRDWARRDRRVAARLRAVDNRRMEYMRELFADFCPDEEEVEARCLLVASLWIGGHFFAAEHGERSRSEVAEVALRGLLS